uniref:Uncharacterized protein n=1 Tax=virus sp. ctPYc18 TaxID=2828251 RepID=A0A8S5RD86_9VIRU|nr:MAG TPA: hypothetical protein [virus sp. ctPYc18]
MFGKEFTCGFITCIRQDMVDYTIHREVGMLYR